MSGLDGPETAQTLAHEVRALDEAVRRFAERIAGSAHSGVGSQTGVRSPDVR